MNTTTCEKHDWMKVANFKRKLMIEDLHISQETTAYNRKEKHFSLKIDVLGETNPIKGLNVESTTKKESERKQIIKLDAGKIAGDELTIDILYCTKCEKQLPPQERATAWLKSSDKDLMADIKKLYLVE